MKGILFSLFCSLILFNCTAQKTNLSETYNICINEKAYQLNLLNKSNKHYLNLTRDFDSLKIKMNIEPSLVDIFDSFLYRNGNKSISMTINKISKSNTYKIKQIDFIHLDGRNTTLHEYSDDGYNIDLNKYRIEMIECINCKDTLSFLIYKNKL